MEVKIVTYDIDKQDGFNFPRKSTSQDIPWVIRWRTKLWTFLKLHSSLTFITKVASNGSTIQTVLTKLNEGVNIVTLDCVLIVNQLTTFTVLFCFKTVTFSVFIKVLQQDDMTFINV